MIYAAMPDVGHITSLLYYALLPARWRRHADALFIHAAADVSPCHAA